MRFLVQFGVFQYKSIAHWNPNERDPVYCASIHQTTGLLTCCYSLVSLNIFPFAKHKTKPNYAVMALQSPSAPMLPISYYFTSILFLFFAFSSPACLNGSPFLPFCQLKSKFNLAHLCSASTTNQLKMLLLKHFFSPIWNTLPLKVFQNEFTVRATATNWKWWIGRVRERIGEQPLALHLYTYKYACSIEYRSHTDAGHARTI